MAFNNPNQQSPINAPFSRGRQQQSGNDNWKSDAFLNFYLPNQAGGRRKLGAIGLKFNKQAEADLINWLNDEQFGSAEEKLSYLIQHLEVEFNMAEPEEGNSFALGAVGS